MQSVPIPLLSSLINLHNNNSSNFSANPVFGENIKRLDLEMPKSSYNDTAISTELECFITKSSSDSHAHSLRMIEDDIIDVDLSSNDEQHTQHKHKHNEIEANLNIAITNGLIDEKRKKKRKHHRNFHCKFLPQKLLYLSRLDQLFSSKIHKLSCGTIDYLFVFGAFVFSSKFMPITILLSVFLVDIPGFIYLLLSCTITVTLTQFGKKLFARNRPDPKALAPKKLDFRTRLTNYAFPSGDTAQAAAYSTSLFCLTQNVWILLLIPNCAWSRVYFGCHWICDCLIGAIVGCFIPLFIWSIIPQQSFINTQQTILHWIH